VETDTLEALLERLQTTKSIDELQVWAHELRDYLGVTHVFYHTRTLKSEQVGAFTYSLEWARHYIQKDYVSIDPVVVGAQRRFHPMDWKALDWSSPAARVMMREAMEHGLGNQGWSVPIWGPQGEFALFCLNHTTDDATWAAFTAKNARNVLVVSHSMHQQAMRIINKELEPPSADLSPREREALTQLSLGQSRAAVADTLQISENTLRAYIDSARHKLGALNVTHAVALALARGIIVPQGALPKY
jgi:LuxR family transcriptional regulator, quorum-sensing system regulator RaiR